MASVQELLAAANANQNPIISGLEGFAQGFSSTIPSAMERIKLEAALQQQAEERQRRVQENAQLMQLLGLQQDQSVSESVNRAAGPLKNPVTAAAKLSKIHLDKEGNVTYDIRPAVEEGPVPSGFRRTADGDLERIPGGPGDRIRIADDDEPRVVSIKGIDYIATTTATGVKRYQPVPVHQPTQSEQAARQYSDAAQQAHDSLRALEESGYNPSQTINAAQSVLPTVFQSTEYQTLDQSRRQFINAILRRESGAAISATEYDTYTRQYFPVPGDSPEVLQKKAAARELKIKGLASEGHRVKSQLAAPKQNNTIALTGNKAARLAELRKKQQEGRLK